MAFVSQDKIFYGASAFLGLLAIIYFGFEYLVSLSPFTISFILFSVFATLLGSGLYTKENTSVLLYIFSAGAYVVGLFYTMSVFDFGSNPVLIALIVSSALFAGIGYLVTQKDFRPEKRQLKIAGIALVLTLSLLIAYDVGSSDVEYSYFISDEVEITDELNIGVFNTESSSYLPRSSSSQNFQGCIYNGTGHLQIQGGAVFSSEAETMNFGPTSKQEDIVFEIESEEIAVEGPLPVEVEEDFRCSREIEGSSKIIVNMEEGLERANSRESFEN